MRAAAMHPEAVWFVAFLPRHSLTGCAWWARFLHPSFRHVLACRALDLETTLLVNHTGRHLVVEIEDRSAGHVLRELLAEGASVLAVECPATPGGALLRGPMTCVEVVKAALGLRAPWTLTPRQLARRLRRAGAAPVLPITPEPIRS